MVSDVPMCIMFICAKHFFFFFTPSGFLQRVHYVASINIKKKRLLRPPKKGSYANREKRENQQDSASKTNHQDQFPFSKLGISSNSLSSNLTSKGRLSVC